MNPWNIIHNMPHIVDITNLCFKYSSKIIICDIIVGHGHLNIRHAIINNCINDAWGDKILTTSYPAALANQQPEN